MSLIRGFLVALVVPMVACRSSVKLEASPMVPSARGEVGVGEDRNGNVTVDLRVKHLAEPARLTPPKQAYVVWVVPRGEPPISKGQLVVDQNLDGRIRLISPHRYFEVLVTAEESTLPERPSDQVVLRAVVDRP